MARKIIEGLFDGSPLAEEVRVTPVKPVEQGEQRKLPSHRYNVSGEVSFKGMVFGGVFMFPRPVESINVEVDRIVRQVEIAELINRRLS